MEFKSTWNFLQTSHTIFSIIINRHLWTLQSPRTGQINQLSDATFWLRAREKSKLYKSFRAAFFFCRDTKKSSPFKATDAKFCLQEKKQKTSSSPPLLNLEAGDKATGKLAPGTEHSNRVLKAEWQWPLNVWPCHLIGTQVHLDLEQFA